MKPAHLFALMVLFVSAAQAGVAQWKPLLSSDKKCVATVPANWGPSVTGDGLQIPNGQSSVRVAWSDESLSDAQASMKMFYAIKSTLENSSARYWVQAKGRPNDPIQRWTVIVPAKGGTCKLDMAFDKEVGQADAKTMAKSLKPH